MTIYALFVCSHLLGYCELSYRLLPVPGVGVVQNRFASLALCREYASKYLGRAPGKDGRWHMPRGGTWICLARHVNTWHEPGQ